MMGYANLEEEYVEDAYDGRKGPEGEISQDSYIIMADKQSVLLDRENELQHASDMSVDSSLSAIRVDIADIDGEESMNLTTTTLKRCKRQVLRPYGRLLMFIGWRCFGRESINYGKLGWKTLNIVYPILVVLLLFYTYAYEIVACQWKLNVHQDTKVITTTTTVSPSTASQNMTNNSVIPFATILPAIRIHIKNLTSQSLRDSKPAACEHIITTYGIPNFLHFVAYIMGFVHFRVQENEQLYAIMEKVFLQATPLHNRTVSQHKMITKLRMLMAVGTIWVICTLVMQGLYEYAFDFPHLYFFRKIGHEVHWILFSIELLGILVLNSVTLAVVGNYITHCEMILFYVRGLALRLQEKSTEIKIAMKDILFVRQNLSVLNGPVARMMSLVAIIFAELIIIGICILVLNMNDLVKVWVYRGIFPVVWLIILCCPLYQAARVNSVCNAFQKIAVEMRVFGYKGCSQLELDSFLIFVSQAKLRAKLFHIPILPKYLIGAVVLGAFVLLILFQTSSIGPTNYWF